jgi:hypothetical protein
LVKIQVVCVHSVFPDATAVSYRTQLESGQYEYSIILPT